MAAEPAKPQGAGPAVGCERGTTKGRAFFGKVGAGEGNRTLVVSLGSFCSAIELHPQGVENKRFIAFIFILF